MDAMGDAVGMLARKCQVLFPYLDERQRRLLMGAEARGMGHGGIRVVARAAGVAEGYAITPSTARFPTPADLIAFVTNADNEPPAFTKPACYS